MKRLIITGALIFIAAVFLIHRCGRQEERALPGKKEAKVCPPAEKIFRREQAPGPAGGKPGAGLFRPFIVLIDSEGRVETEKIMRAGPKGSWAEFVKETENGDIILLLRNREKNAENDGFELVCVNREGELLWKEESGFFGNERAAGIETGKVSRGRGGSGFYVAESGESGDFSSIRVFGAEFYEWGYKSIVSGGGGSIITGESTASGGDSGVFMVTRKNSAGKKEWANTYGGSGFSRCHDIERADSGYVCAGFTTREEDRNTDVFIIKIDGSGKSLWEGAFGGRGEDEAYAISGEKGEFYAAGTAYSGAESGYDIYVIKISEDGRLLWTKTIFGPRDEAAFCVSALKGGGAVLAGAVCGSKY